ncbi:MAG TPA: hypothetical protein VFJ30_12525, partial [Phycisphaerae bacterium]|nr:hypothetical protein [Phycisphaerae bacterium]
MDMQIPRLRKLFEARVPQITSLLSEDTPPELGDIDPTLRVLKGFLFALEGMLRKDDLRSLPFTARGELFDKIGRAIQAMETLPESLNRQQAIGVLRVIDTLHRLCLRENLMASGLDASRLGKFTVILEHKLGEVLATIDGVAHTAEGRVEEIDQATRQRLAEIEGVYTKQAQALESSASQAVGAIQRRQAEAMDAVEQLAEELRRRGEQCQGLLDEQLAVSRRTVDEAQDEQQAVQTVLERTRGQLTAAEAAIEAMKETALAAEAAREDLQAKLSQGQEVIGSIRGFLEAGTQAGSEASAKVAEAEQCLARMQQTGRELAEAAAEARQQQERAVAAARETAAAAE